MMRFLAVVVLCLPAFGQTVYSGHAGYSGQAVLGSSFPGAPLTYSARTDNCVTGTESGCLPGTTTGETGSALSFLLRNSDASPFADISSGNAGMNSTGTDPDFGAYLIMATDETTASAPNYGGGVNSGGCLASGSGWAASWDMGSAGEYDAFSVDSKLLLIGNQNGNQCVLGLNPAAIHAKTCATASPACVVNTGFGTSNQLVGVAFNFSTVPTETNVLYALQSNMTQVNKLTLCRYSTDPNCSAANTVNGAAYVDFTNTNTDVCGSDITKQFGNTTAFAGPGSGTWNSEFLSAADGSVAYGTGGAQDWLTGWTPAVTQSFILPTIGNSAKHAFQATAVTGATSNSTEPTWSSCSPSCTDGGVTWTDIGTIGGQGPGFTIFIYRPGNGCSMINTRTGYIYRSSSSSAPAGLIQTQDGVVCTQQTGAVCSGSSTARLPDLYTLHDLSMSRSGQYVIASPTGSAHTSSSWNWGTWSGQASNSVWTGSAGTNINNGIWSSSASYAAHDVVVDGTLGYPGVFYTANVSSTPTTCSGSPCPPNSSPTQWTQTETAPLDIIYDTTSVNGAPCTDYTSCNGHQAQGYLQKWYANKLKQAFYSNPVINGSLNTGNAILGNTLPADFHGSFRNSGTQDLTPVFVFNTSVPAASISYTAACYLEVCATPATGPVGGIYTLWRLGHTYNTGSSPFFSSQNNVGVVSYLGDLVAFGTDMMGTRGDQNSSNAVCANPIRGMYKPVAGMTLTINGGVGDTVYPVSGDDIYQTTIAGVSSGSTPTGGWGTIEPITITQVAATSSTATYTYTGNAVTAGGTIIVSGSTNSQFNGGGSPAGTGMTIATASSSQFTIAGTYTPISTTADSGTGYTTQAWGTATMQNIGANSCRSDIVILDTLSAHAAP